MCLFVKISISNELWPDSLLSSKGSSAQGDGLKAQKPLGMVKIHTRAVVLNDRRIWLFTGTYLQKRLREIISLRKYIDHSRVSADLFVI